MLFVIEVDNDGFKVYDSAGNLIDPAKDSSVQSILTRQSDGTQRAKVTDGTNNAAVKNADPGASDYGLVVRPVGALGPGGDVNVQKWLGSLAPTVGQKAMAASLPVTMASDQSPIPVSPQGIVDLVAGGKIFCTTLQANSGSSTADTPMLYLKNPVGSGKSIYTWRIQAGTSITNTAMIFKVFKDPTITVNGTALTIVNRHIGGSAVSVLEAYQKPTASSNGTPMSALTQGQNNNALVFSDEFSLKLDPGHSLIVTARPTSNDREVLITAIWMEQ